MDDSKLLQQVITQSASNTARETVHGDQQKEWPQPKNRWNL